MYLQSALRFATLFLGCEPNLNLGIPNSQYAGNVEGFTTFVRTLPQKFAAADPTLVALISEFLTDFLPPDTISKFCAKESTSRLEGYHSHHHAFQPKFRYFNKYYRERTYLHNLLWNTSRLSALQKKKEIEVPRGLLQGKDFLRELQRKLGLLVVSKEKQRKPWQRRTPPTAPAQFSYATSSEEQNKMWD